MFQCNFCNKKSKSEGTIKQERLPREALTQIIFATTEDLTYNNSAALDSSVHFKLLSPEWEAAVSLSHPHHTVHCHYLAIPHHYCILNPHPSLEPSYLPV